MFTPYYLNVVLGDVPHPAMLAVQSEFVDQPAKRERVVQTGPSVPGLRYVEILATRLCIVREQSWLPAESEKVCHGHNLVHEEHRRGGSREPTVFIR